MSLSKLQTEVINTKEPKVVVLASAAAGKTRCMTERVRKMLRDGVDPYDIACITFTNLSAQELRDRLGADYRDEMYVGTIHGLANKFLVTHGISTGSLIENEQFDQFFSLLQEHPYCVRHIKHILLDEAQDTSPDQYDFIFKMIKPETFFVVGDTKQSIFSFRQADPELLEDLCYEPGVTVYNLNENYRNGSNILAYAKRIIAKAHMRDESVPVRSGGLVYEGETDILNLKGWIKSKGTYGSWAVLCSTNDDIAMVRKELEKDNIPTVTFRQGDLNRAQLENLMKSDAVKVLTRHSSKGLEFDNVAVWAPQWWGGDEAYRVNYVAATRARDILLWMEAPKKKKTKRKYF